MKPFAFKYERKQETDDEKEENVIPMEESEDEDFGSFQQETETAEMEKVIYLESSMVDFSTNMLVLNDNVRSARMKTHHSYVCGIQVFVKIVVFKSQLRAVLPECILQVDCRKELFGFQIMQMSKKNY
ncbi:hypothetical protein AVEN_39794-1 [Araneus ventricosus]|uniref:Uncharacterized protein n=1 Tax=Araneus ventricosus TaxID=182803 RepID=A0A4Y2VYG5_ARAVE|nr:hypothetical protein AVEN_39794-1 [Araneus ventricosus]